MDWRAERRWHAGQPGSSGCSRKQRTCQRRVQRARLEKCGVSQAGFLVKKRKRSPATKVLRVGRAKRH